MKYPKQEQKPRMRVDPSELITITVSYTGAFDSFAKKMNSKYKAACTNITGPKSASRLKNRGLLARIFDRLFTKKDPNDRWRYAALTVHSCKLDEIFRENDIREVA